MTIPTRSMPPRARRDESPDPARHGPVSMALHWATLALLVALFATAWARESAGGGEAAASLLMVHRSLGAAMWATTLLRLAWKWTAARPPPLPATLPRLQRVAARANEAALLALLALQPLTGLAQSVYRGKAFPVLGLEFPAVVARDRGLVHVFEGLHANGAALLLLLVAAHALAAVFHHVVLRDDVLATMLPRWLARSRGAMPRRE